MTAVNRRATFRRTRRTAVGVVGAALLTFLLTEPGCAAPDSPSQESGFNNGTGAARALARSGPLDAARAPGDPRVPHRPRRYGPVRL